MSVIKSPGSAFRDNAPVVSEAYTAYRAAIAATRNHTQNLDRALRKTDDHWEEIRQAAKTARNSKFPLERAEQNLGIKGTPSEKAQHIRDTGDPGSSLRLAYQGLQTSLENYYTRKEQKEALETDQPLAYPASGQDPA